MYNLSVLTNFIFRPRSLYNMIHFNQYHIFIIFALAIHTSLHFIRVATFTHPQYYHTHYLLLFYFIILQHNFDI